MPVLALLGNPRARLTAYIPATVPSQEVGAMEQALLDRLYAAPTSIDAPPTITRGPYPNFWRVEV